MKKKKKSGIKREKENTGTKVRRLMHGLNDAA
jgi:hypothetical protein